MREPKFWDEAALEACRFIFAEPEGYTTLERLRETFDSFVDTHFDGSVYFSDDIIEKQIVTDKWSYIGSIASKVAERRELTLTPKSVAEVLVRKQRDYGHENIRRFGRQGLMIRCHDKIARLENLCGSDFEPNNESIDDTLLDIIGYSAIGMMWEQEDFLLQLASPKKSGKLLAPGPETR